MKRTATLTAILALALLPQTAGAIVGGHKVHAGAYPYTVRLVTNGNSPREGGFCGGTLIAPSVVLTAAHCVLENIDGAKGRHYMQPEDLNVLVGSAFVGSGELVKSRAIIVHPKFSKPLMQHDVALVILEHAVILPTLPLAHDTLTAGTRVATAGWGRLDYYSGDEAVHMRSAMIRTTTRTACRKGNPVSGSIRLDPNTEFCAGAPGRGICMGDSGGPLIARINGIATLVGVVSSSYGCGDGEHPAIYTRVTAIRAWAESTISALG